MDNRQRNTLNGILNSVSTDLVAPFTVIFALRLGANSFQTAMLSSGPAIAGLLVLIPGARWVDRQRDKKKVTSWLMAANRVFYVDALNTVYPSTFADYFHAVTRELILNVLREVAVDLHRQISEEDQNFIADFYAFACVGITVRWIKDGMNEPPDKVTGQITGILKGSMARALAR